MARAITLDALKVLDAIDKKGSFSAAAESLFKVPSALTYTIQKLETDLGCKLFDRQGQRAVLTPVGELVLTQGREILHAAYKLEEAVQELETGWEASLTLALDTVLSDGPLLTLMGEFTQLGKQVGLNFRHESLGGSWDALYSGRADIAIGVSGELPKGQYHIVPLGLLQFVFAVAADHPLAAYEEIIPSEALLQFPAIVASDTSVSLAQRSSGLFDSRQIIRVPSMQIKVSAQCLGLGVGFLPRHLLDEPLSKGALVIKPVELPRPSHTLYLAWRKGAQGKALNWFVERLPLCDWGLLREGD